MTSPEADSGSGRSLPVVHSVATWLDQTLTWIYPQVRELPPPFRPLVVCDTRRNLDQFPHPDVAALSDAPLLWLPWRASRLPWFPRRFLARRLEASGARLLHSHFGPRGWQDIAAARRSGVKHVVSFYGYDVDYVPRSSARWRVRYAALFAAIDRVLCEGPFMAGSLERLGCPREKIRIQRLGVDLEKLPFRPRLRAPGEPLRVLMAASFREKKGIPDGLEALGRLAQRCELQVTLLGDATAETRAQEEKRRILQALERSGLASRARLLGYRPHAVFLEEAYAHHVFLSPSVTAADGDSEGGAPLGLVEAAASGMPVVATRHCDVPQVVEHGETGRLADEHDIDGLVEELAWLVDHPEAWEPMASAARRHVERNFDARIQAAALAALYRELLDPEPNPEATRAPDAVVAG